ncbi:PREDICTED: dual specificity protein kinase splB-like isoform X2 [Trachymyrmex cornetzi]|uniref:dual specificity protein kinase splB-like isoform X2 n=1 Tax=Trachymyrmex cornetzi TaxID=471704 RepID=UPI00084F5D2B|nr:PREDICTED: dual specificity protein kinase splB-like isoform X2 [Trachymyrmex cornetzi]
MMRCAKFGNGKRSHSSAKRGVDNVTMTTSDKVNKRNDKKIDSPQSCQQQSTSGYSTPITKKRNTNVDKEDSPDFDYSPSPILPTFTQEGGNEVAWDWQSSMSRTPENSSKKRNVHCETPKGTKLFQRKRISNSPLLYKPLKRKTIKMENIENIGQFAAELQALNERMRIIKQNDNNHSNDCVEKKEVPMLTNISDKEETSNVQDDIQNSIEKRSNGNEQRNNSVGGTNDNTSKKETSGAYDDLFDDSVDDDIIRCTQEIEEKFNLLERGNSTQLEIKKEDSCKNDVSNKTISVQSSSSENCKNALSVHLCDNSSLKTYSKLSLRRDANSSIHSAVQNSKDTYKPCPNNNNNTIRSFARKSCDNKKLSKNNTVDLFDFYNDSFDDWLVSCVEEEKLLPKSDVSSIHKNDSTKVQANYKHLTNAPLKSEVKSADSFKPMTKPETSNANYLQNRKFFKTKSLSEQPVNRNASAKGSRASVRGKKRW